MGISWSSQQYLKFDRERSRAAKDLLNAVMTLPVRSAIDLGCGPGNSTALLAERFPDARLVGIDNAPDMIDTAKARVPYATFRLETIEAFEASEKQDLIFANASLQWIPAHATVIPRLAGFLAEGGTLAIQMPDNLDEPSHRSMRDVASLPVFADKLAHAAAARTAIASADDYYRMLRPHCGTIDIWRTTYTHVLDEGLGGIVEWLKGSGLLPFLKPLSKEEQASYLAEYLSRLSKFYTPQPGGEVLLAFPRLFIVAMR